MSRTVSTIQNQSFFPVLSLLLSQKLGLVIIIGYIFAFCFGYNLCTNFISWNVCGAFFFIDI